MNKVTILSLFPESFEFLKTYGVIGKAIENGLLELEFVNIRDFSSNGFYRDFLDDLKSEMGLMIKTKYNNFIEPAIYDNSTQKQAFVDFLANINVFREEREKTPYTEDNFEKGVVNG